MRKFLILLVVFCLVAGLSGAAYAQHSVLVVDGGNDPEAGVWVRIHILLPGGWSYVDVQTDNWGVAADNLLVEDDDAEFWWAEIIDTSWEYDSMIEFYETRTTTLHTDPN